MISPILLCPKREILSIAMFYGYVYPCDKSQINLGLFIIHKVIEKAQPKIS